MKNVIILSALSLLILVYFAGQGKCQQKDGFIKVNGSDIYYKIIGKGEPIIVIHGGPVLDHS